MYGLKQMYSSAKDISHNLSGKASTGLAAVVLGVGLAGPLNADDNLPLQPGAPHALTYKDDSGKDVTVPDLTGVWQTKFKGFPDNYLVIQKGNTFEGYSIPDNIPIDDVIKDPSKKSILRLSGKVENSIVTCNIHWRYGSDITAMKSKLTDNGKKFQCVGEETRDYYKIR